MADFFERESDKEVESTKIKVGEKEYDADELNKLVGLGEIARDVETKYNTKIDRVYPEYTKTTQKVKEYERELEELRQKVQPSQQITPQELSKEQAQLAKEQLKALGYLPADELDQRVQKKVAESKAVDEIISTSKNLVKEMEDKGYPQVDLGEFFKFMDEGGYKNPKAAYREMFADQIEQIDQDKLGKIKRTQPYTANVTSAGSKSPVPQKITRDNLKSAVQAVLYANGE